MKHEMGRRGHSKRLPTPRQIRSLVPLEPRAVALVARTRGELGAILRGEDAHRLCLIVGPCSVHSYDGALEFARLLARAAERTRDALLIVMRLYFEKPRTRRGWTGLLLDPHLDSSGRVSDGLALTRKLLVKTAALGVPCGSELLSTTTVAHVEDALTWAAIGARNVESQPHRQVASGLGLPVGVKNTVDGRIEPALAAMDVIGSPQALPGIDDDGRVAEQHTLGNALAHLVLRGGASGPNHDAKAVAAAAEAARRQSGLARPLIIDASHGNSQKDYRRQPEVFRAVLQQAAEGQGAIAGVMLESNLEPGNQAHVAGRPVSPGLSITDACLGWTETESLIEEAGAAVRAKAKAPRRRFAV
jgi:3-deoxy-7-phosphoheptulonate synthase